MRYLIVTMALALAGWPNHASAAETPLVVHEWGTFTSFSDSQGELIDFNPLIENKLPEFVFTQEDQGSNDISVFLTKRSIWAKQRMETPVTYFYTDHPRSVNARVDFPDGLLTEFYPPARSLTSNEQKHSRLDWGQIRLIPQEEFDRTLGAELRKAGSEPLPVVTGDNHYGHARGTDSAIVQFNDPQGHGLHHEKFLFYRGVGNFNQPGKLTAKGGGEFRFHNDSDQDLQHLFLVAVDGQTIRFSYVPVAKAGTELSMTLPKAASSLDEVGAALVKSLVESGLYEKEATSMVNTWRTSWLGESGTRVLYALPQSWTDQLIPLTIEPAPETCLRVMIGRLEIMTPETEKELTDLIVNDTRGNAFPNAANNVLGRLGRFGGAAVYRVARDFPTEELKDRAGQIANQLMQADYQRDTSAAVE